MITFTLVAILGALLVIVLMNLFKKDPKPLPAPVRPVEDLANLKVTDARTGDVLSIAGAGDRMTDLDYTVDRGTRWKPARAPGWNSPAPIWIGASLCASAAKKRWKSSCTPIRARSRWKISD